MCNFFSCITLGDGRLIYCDWNLRQKLIKEKDFYIPDSHTSIAEIFGIDEDKCNKYEYNPILHEFTIDQLNALHDDSAAVKCQLENMDWKSVVKPMVIKPIVNPMSLTPPTKITKKRIQLLKEWASVRESYKTSSVWYSAVRYAARNEVLYSVGGPVLVSVRDAVCDLVGDSVWDSVLDSVLDSVWDSVWDSVRASVGDSVRASVGEEVWDLVGAYVGTFFNIPQKSWKNTKFIKEKKYPFQAAVNLWESGLVASFNGKLWRLHGVKKSEILYEIGVKDLMKGGDFLDKSSLEVTS